MKKTLIAVAAAAALTTSAFAEITFGSWGRAIAVPVASDGKDTVAGQTMSWGGYGRATGITARGQDADGVSGFVMDIRAKTDGNSDTAGDAHYWFKPTEMIKVSIGLRDFCPLRSNIGLASWDFIRPSMAADDGVTFDCSTTLTGLYVEANPTDALYAYVAVPLATSFDKAEDVYHKSVVAAAYTIDGVGKVKVGFDGSSYVKDTKTGTIAAAFDLTSVENLTASVGVKYGIYDNSYEGAEYRDNLNLGVEVAYNVSDELRVAGNASVTFAEVDLLDSVTPKMVFGVGASYALGNGTSLVADVRYLGERKAEASGYSATLNKSQVAALAGVQKSFGAANVGVGFQVQTENANGAGLQDLHAVADTGKTKTVWAIPVVITASF